MNNQAAFFNGFASRLKHERMKRNYSQDKLSEILGFGQKYIAKLECNANFPSLDAIIVLADFFNVSVDYLLFGNHLCSNENLQVLISKLSDKDLEILTDVAQSLVNHNANESNSDN